ncbi:HD domain-containing phosphohydrolase [Nocardia tengchongensis]|uniref:HD domain-containing phosphohydrolase n=1 Tax=Nocardia tengchongensis TaxID=2055889 RepID=UPI0036B3F1FD
MEAGTGVRLAEAVGALSLATDLGLGQPQEHVLRQTVIATRLAELAGVSAAEQGAAFYVSLLAWVGCVADSHELAQWFGDDRRVRADSYEVDKTAVPMLRFLVGHLAADTGLRRITLLGRFFAGGFRDAMDSFVAHCQTTSDIADRLGLPDEVRRALPQAFERWDGKGAPAGLSGDRIEPVMRIVQIADDAEASWRTGGMPAVLELLRARRGTEFDPALVDLCCREAPRIFGDLDSVDAWSTVIEHCPALRPALRETELTAVLGTFADYADLKSPWFLGHSRATAALAADAARRHGLPEPTVRLVERAALVCRLGVIGISAGTWAKPGPLSAIEWERVRTVPYLTERVLSRQPRLAELGALAALVHERMDGSGYPRGLTGAAIPFPARLLAAAEVYQALAEERPHRAALAAPERARLLLGEAVAGRLDPAAVRAVLDAAGHRPARRVTAVAGLTERELDVLALLVRGRTNREIAAALSITPRTAGSHIEHIYTKIGMNTRGAAAMFAMRHGLVEAAPEP